MAGEVEIEGDKLLLLNIFLDLLNFQWRECIPRKEGREEGRETREEGGKEREKEAEMERGGRDIQIEKIKDS